LFDSLLPSVVVPTEAEASILHADLDAFFASVEQRDDPSLRGQPVAVGGGVVLAASYEAKAFGVHGAMGGAEARRRCPQLIFVPPRFHAYVDASRQVFDVFRDTTPEVEGLSIDEAFLHVGGLRHLVGPPVEVGRRLRESVLERSGLTITVGIARTRFLAKVASGVAKPDGLLLVPPDCELDFLRPLPIGKLWGFGPATTRTLARVGIATVADVADVPETSLVAVLGRPPVTTCSRSCIRATRAGCSRRGHATARSDPRVLSAGHIPGWTRSTPFWSPWSTGSPGGCEPPIRPARR